MPPPAAILDVSINEARLTREFENFFRKIEKRGINFGSGPNGFGTISGDAKEFEKSLKAAESRVLAFGANTSVILGVARSFKYVVDTTIEVNKALTGINAIAGLSRQSLDGLGKSLFEVGKNTGQTFKTVSDAALEFSRQGLGVQESLKRTRDALILTRLTGLSVTESTQDLTAAINSFSDAAFTSTDIINKFARVDSAFAVSAADLAEAVKRVGSTAQESGVGLDQLLGVVTSLQQTTSRGGAIIGNALKTIFTKLQDTSVLDQLQSFDVQVRDLQGNIIPLLTILENLSSRYVTLGQEEKNYISKNIANLYQINLLKAALKDLNNQYSITGQATKLAAQSSDDAIERNAELNKSFDAQINKIKLFAQEIANVAGKQGASRIGNIFDNFKNLSDKIPTELKDAGSQIGENIIKGIADYVTTSGPILFLYAFGKILKTTVSFATTALKSLTDYSAGQKDSLSIDQQINGVLAQRADLLAKISLQTITQTQLERELLRELSNAGNLSSIISNTSRTTARNLSGRIPNFADPVGDAIEREKRSGIPDSVIRVGRSTRLQTTDNPLGFGVYNLIDEPGGLEQGIDKKKKLGLKNDQSGFVPNFSFFDYLGKTSPQEASSFANFSNLLPKALQDFARAQEKFARAVDKLSNAAAGTGPTISNPYNPIRLPAGPQPSGLNVFGNPQFPSLIEYYRSLTNHVSSNFSISSRGFPFEDTVPNNPVVNSSTGEIENSTSLLRRRCIRQESIGRLNSGEPYVIAGPSSSSGAIRLPQYSLSQSPYSAFFTGGIPNISSEAGSVSGGGKIFAPGRYAPGSTYGSTFTGFLPNITPEEGSIGIGSRIFAPTVSTTPFSPIQNNLQTTYNNLNSFAPSTLQNNAFKAANIRDSISLSQNRINEFRINRLNQIKDQSLGAFGFGIGGSSALKELQLRSPEDYAKITEQIKNRRTTGALVGSIAAPIIAENLSSLTDDRRAKRAISGIGDAASLGLTAGFLTGNPLVGGAVTAGGLAKTLYEQYSGKPKDVLEEFTKALEDSKEKLNLSTDALSQFQEKTAQINEIVAGERKSPGASQFNNLQTARSQAFSSLSVADRSTILNAYKSGGDKEVEAAFESVKNRNLQKYTSSKVAFGLSNLNANPNDIKDDSINAVINSLLSLPGNNKKSIYDNLSSNPKFKLDSNSDLSGILGSLLSGTSTEFSSNILKSSSQITDPKVLNAIKQALISKVNIGIPKETDELKQLSQFYKDKTLNPKFNTLRGFNEQINNQNESSFLNTLIQKNSEQDSGSFLKQLASSSNFSLKQLELQNTSPLNLAFSTKSSEITQAKEAARVAQFLNTQSLSTSFNTSDLNQKIKENFGKQGYFNEANRDKLDSVNTKISDFSAQAGKGTLDLGSAKEYFSTNLQDIREKLIYNSGDAFLKDLEDFFSKSLNDINNKTIESAGINNNLTNKLKEIEVDFQQKRIEAIIQSEEGILKRYKRGEISSSSALSGLQSDFARKNYSSEFSPSGALKDTGTLVRQALSYNSSDFWTDFQKNGVEAVQGIKSEFGDAIKSFANGTKTAGDAFRSFAINVASNIQGRLIDLGLNSIIGGIFNKKANGGLISHFSSGGLVNGGSGTKDDVPAALSSGEFVIKRSAVDKYGQEFFRGLNNGADVSLINQYNYDDPKNPRKGIQAYSDFLSSFAFEDTNNPQTNIRNARESNLQSYLNDFNSYNNQKAAALKAFKKQKQQQLIGAYIGAAVAGVGAGLNGGFSAKASVGLGSDVGAPSGTANYYGYSSSNFGSKIGGGGYPYGFARGGSVFGGDSITDNIPALLMGGEYVLKKSAVDRIGIAKLNQINNGQLRMATGGLVGNDSGGSSDLSDAIERLIKSNEILSRNLGSQEKQGTNNKNNKSGGDQVILNFTSNVSIAPNGQVTSSQESSQQGNGGPSVENVKKLQELIQSNVYQIILKEKENGGLLSPHV